MSRPFDGAWINAQTNIIEIYIEQVPQLDPQLAAIAADCLQNFRAALNYLAWELAKWNLKRQGLPRPPVRATQFPIASKLEDFPTDRKPVKRPTTRKVKKPKPHALSDIFDEHVYLIEHFQPYISRHVPIDLHPLVLLQKFTNADKHETLQFVFPTMHLSFPQSSYTGIDCTLGAGKEFMHGTFKPNAKWAEFEVVPTGPNPRVEMDDYFATEIAFEEGLRVIYVLRAAGDAVIQILSAFKPVF